MKQRPATADAKIRLTYDTETCGRCGGSGSYSYCQMHGSVCFKCGGRKWQFTKAGAKAQKAVADFITENFSVPVESLKIGDRIKVDGYTRTIAAITTDGGSRYGAGTDDNGQTIWRDYVSLEFTKPIPSRFGAYSSHGFCQGQMIVKAVAGADWELVLNFARTVKRGVSIVAVETAIAS